MSITKWLTTKSIDYYTNAAPNGPSTCTVGHKDWQAWWSCPSGKAGAQLALPAEWFAEVDQATNALSISRAAFMKQALAKALQV